MQQTMSQRKSRREGRLERVVDHIHEMLHELREGFIVMSAELDRLTQSVANLRTVEQSSNALLRQLAQMIRDNANDPAKITALADDLDQQAADISAAITENTPAAGGGATGATGPSEPPVT